MTHTARHTESSLDGTASQIITVTVHGTNDAATITASATEDTSVTEAAAGNATSLATARHPPASTLFPYTTLFRSQAHFAAVAPAALAGTYGNFSFDSATGVWS